MYDDHATMSILIDFGAIHSWNVSRSPKWPKQSTKPLFWRSRSSKVIDFGAYRETVYDFLLEINSNLGSISHRFWNMATYWLKTANIPYPFSFNALAPCDPFRIYVKALRIMKLESSKFGDPSLRRFWLIHPCDGMTEGRTDGRTELRWLRRAEAVAAFARKNDATWTLSEHSLFKPSPFVKVLCHSATLTQSNKEQCRTPWPRMYDCHANLVLATVILWDMKWSTTSQLYILTLRPNSKPAAEMAAFRGMKPNADAFILWAISSNLCRDPQPYISRKLVRPHCVYELVPYVVAASQWSAT